MNTQQEKALLMEAIDKLAEINKRRKDKAQHDLDRCQCFQCLAFRTLNREVRLIERQEVAHG